MNNITLSINPSYLCNLRCEFCYLSKSQLGDAKIVDPNKLMEVLAHISAYRSLRHVDLYGGEVALIPAPRIEAIINTIKFFYHNPINVITNLTSVPDFLFRDDVDISVSWDYKARARNEEVYRNMLLLKKPFHVLLLASDNLLKLGKDEIVHVINLLNNLDYLVSFEIKPYSESKFNSYKKDFVQFENWVQIWIDLHSRMNFQFTNIQKIVDVHLYKNSSWSDDHLYITPEGELAVLDFDSAGKEFFKKVEDIPHYEDWCRKEKLKFNNDEICGSCKYLGRCLSEHLVVATQGQSCSGFFHLLENNKKLAGPYAK